MRPPSCVGVYRVEGALATLISTGLWTTESFHLSYTPSSPAGATQPSLPPHPDHDYVQPSSLNGSPTMQFFSSPFSHLPMPSLLSRGCQPTEQCERWLSRKCPLLPERLDLTQEPSPRPSEKLLTIYHMPWSDQKGGPQRYH